MKKKIDSDFLAICYARHLNDYLPTLTHHPTDTPFRPFTYSILCSVPNHQP